MLTEGLLNGLSGLLGRDGSGLNAPSSRFGETKRLLARDSVWEVDSESRHPRARVAQLDRASASGAEGCGFDPRLAHHLTVTLLQFYGPAEMHFQSHLR